MRKNKRILLTAAAISILCASTSFANWQQNEKGYWYQYDNGSYAKSGVKDIGGTYYAFDDNGYMLKGWQYISFCWNYFAPETGAQVFGWIQVDGKWYYLDPNNSGVMHTYWLNIGKNRYYMNEQGQMQVGVFYLTDSTAGSDYAYQTDENGALIRNTTKKNGAKTIRYDENGVMMFLNDTTKAVAGATGDSSWQYVRNQADMQDQKKENNNIINEEAVNRKNSLYDDYKSKVRKAKKSQKERKKTEWEDKARKKLSGYLSEEDIEAYILEVEKGYYRTSTVKNNAKESDDEESDYDTDY